jgi:CRISPR-associated protein Csd2
MDPKSYEQYEITKEMLGDQTGFSVQDFRILCDALLGMWDLDRSAARGLMATRALIAFRHRSRLGDARAHQLFERVRFVHCKNGPPRSFADYDLEIDRAGLPEAITVHDLCRPDEYEAFFR